MRKKFFIVGLLSLMIPLFLTTCKKDEDDKDTTEEVDPKLYLWDKWWYNDTQTNMFFSAGGTCKYFDDSFNGTWEWIGGSDTMKINGITTPVSWKMFFRNIQEHSFNVSFDNDSYTSSFPYTDQE